MQNALKLIKCKNHKLNDIEQFIGVRIREFKHINSSFCGKFDYIFIRY